MNSYDGCIPVSFQMTWSCTHIHMYTDSLQSAVCVRERARDDLCGVMASGVGLWLGQLAALMRWRVLIAQRWAPNWGWFWSPGAEGRRCGCVSEYVIVWQRLGGSLHQYTQFLPKLPPAKGHFSLPSHSLAFLLREKSGSLPSLNLSLSSGVNGHTDSHLRPAGYLQPSRSLQMAASRCC